MTWQPSDLGASEYATWDAFDTSTLYDAASGGANVTTPGDAVYRMEDTSGNGLHLTQSTLGATPVLASDGGIYYDSGADGNDFLRCNSAAGFNRTFDAVISFKPEIGETKILLGTDADLAAPKYALIAQTGETSYGLSNVTVGSIYINGTLFTGTTRDAAFQALTLGEWNTVAFTSIEYDADEYAIIGREGDDEYTGYFGRSVNAAPGTFSDATVRANAIAWALQTSAATDLTGHDVIGGGTISTGVLTFTPPVADLAGHNVTGGGTISGATVTQGTVDLYGHNVTGGGTISGATVIPGTVDLHGYGVSGGGTISAAVVYVPSDVTTPANRTASVPAMSRTATVSEMSRSAAA